MTFMAQSATERWEAAAGVAALDSHMWFDLARGLSCTEADAFANFLGAWVDENARLSFLAWHAEGDYEDDDHFHLREGQT